MKKIVKSRLVKDWRQSWKWLSVHAAVACSVAPVLYEHLDVVQTYLSPRAFHWTQFALGVLVIIARLVKQK